MEKKIKNQLLLILKEYGNRNQKADSEFYLDVVDILKDGLEDYLSEVVIIDNDNLNNPEYAEYTKGLAGKLSSACYYADKKTLVIFDRNVKYDISMAINAENYKGHNESVFYNLLVCQIILNEFEYIKQTKKQKEDKDMESKLLNITKDNISAYEFNLHKRVAEIRSLEDISNLIKDLNMSDFDIDDFFEKKLEIAYMSGYTYVDEDFLSPVEMYARMQNMDEGSIRNISSTIDLDDRLLYGLPMTIYEYKAIFGEGPITNSKNI